jgi:divalent metal cation (Fe/Co/Zn/Cd) transporter
VAGLAVTVFIAHVGWEVTSDVVHRLMDGIDPELLAAAEAAAGGVPAVRHVHARGRWTGRTLRLELEGWLDGGVSVAEADGIGQAVAQAVGHAVPEVRSLTWSARSV